MGRKRLSDLPSLETQAQNDPEFKQKFREDYSLSKLVDLKKWAALAEQAQSEDLDDKYLRHWPDAVRATPCSILQCALFGINGGSTRVYYHEKVMASVGGVDICYTGEELDQYDRITYLAVLHAFRNRELGNTYATSLYEMLEIAGLSDNGQNRLLVKERLKRLVSGVLIIKTKKFCFYGSLLGSAYIAESGELRIGLNRNTAMFFELDRVTYLDSDILTELRTSQLALWLHSFYSTHKDTTTYLYSVDTLRKLSLSREIKLNHFRDNLIKAFDRISEIYDKRKKTFRFSITDKDRVQVLR